MILILNNIYDRIKLAMEVSLFMFPVLREGVAVAEKINAQEELKY